MQFLIAVDNQNQLQEGQGTVLHMKLQIKFFFGLKIFKPLEKSLFFFLYLRFFSTTNKIKENKLI